jgi:hypothetical protein
LKRRKRKKKERRRRGGRKGRRSLLPLKGVVFVHPPLQY